MASGSNLSKFLYDKGLSAGKVDMPKAFLENVYWHPKTHKLYNTRLDEPIDESLVASIMQEGIREPILIRIEHDERGEEVLAGCDGSRRWKNGMEAQRRLLKTNPESRLLKDGKLAVKIERLPGDCSDKDFLLARQDNDIDPLKKQHSVSHLAHFCIQADKEETTIAEMQKRLPRTWNSTVVSAVLTQWGSMLRHNAKLVARFDAEEIPAGLLVVLRVAPDRREALIETLLERGITSAARAVQLINTEAQRAAEIADDTGGTPEIETIEDEDVVEDEDGEDEDTEDAEDVPAPKRTPTPRTKMGAVRTEKVHKLWVAAEEKPRVTRAERCFFAAGAVAGKDRSDDKAVVKFITEMMDKNPEAAHAILGVLWRQLGGLPLPLERLCVVGVIETLNNGGGKPSAEAPKKRGLSGKAWKQKKS